MRSELVLLEKGRACDGVPSALWPPISGRLFMSEGAPASETMPDPSPNEANP